MQQENNKNTKPSSEDIQAIVKNNTITIPAGILYTFLQFTEIGSQRGAFRANELSMVGSIYDTGTQLLNKLIEEQWKPPPTTTPTTTTPPTKKLRKKTKSNIKNPNPQ